MMQAAAGGGENVESVFSTHLYKGTASAQSITTNIDLSGEGGMLWIKNRSQGGAGHYLFDTERGRQYALLSHSANSVSESAPTGSTSSQDLTSFNSNGFSIGTDWNYNLNVTGSAEYAAWTFRKAPNFFDVVTYTGNGSAGREISHNLGSVPGMIWVKKINGGGDWVILHRSLGAQGSGGIRLNRTDAASSNGQHYWGNGTNGIDPTSTVFTVDNHTWVNNSGDTYVAYLFAHNNSDGGFGASGDQDIIKCGSYTGNGSATSGTVVDLGFEPQFVLIKASSTAQAAVMFDSMRGVSSAEDDQVQYPMYAQAEGSPQSFIAFRSNGFQLQTDNYEANGNGISYIYMAIRRPMAEAETGADVFKATYGNSSSNDPPGWSSPTGFVVDASLDMNFGGSATDSATFGARLIQNKYSDQLYNTSGPTFQNWDGQNYDHQNGFADSADGGTGDLGYMWQRKAGAFDAFTFKGTGSNMTHNHNLAGEVGMAWWFTVSTSTHVYVYARPLGANKYMRLNLNYDQVTDTVLWQNTHPTNTEFYTGGGYNNTNEEHIVLLFGNQSGVSKVGTFTGNGTNQNIDCGFSNGIRLLMVKKVGTGNWYFWDEANLGSQYHYFWYIKNQAGFITNQDTIDTYSAGFNIKFNTNQSINTNGDTYLFYAVAA